MSKLANLTDLQLLLLGVLWDRGEATANDIHTALKPRKRLARGTIGAMLHRLERQGMISHRADGREYYYRALVGKDAVTMSSVDRLVSGLFGGDVAEMAVYAVSKSDLAAGDAAKLKALLEAHVRGAKKR